MKFLLQDFLVATNQRTYRVDSDYVWDCYGEDAFIISCETDDFSVACVYDIETQQVYEANAYDYASDSHYRYISEDYVDTYFDEAERKGVIEIPEVTPVLYAGQILDIITDMVSGNFEVPEIEEDENEDENENEDEDEDENVDVYFGEVDDDTIEDELADFEVTLDSDVAVQCMLAAHHLDITLNEFVRIALKNAIQEYQVE